MRAGFVTDVHYGADVSGDAVALLERIADEFRAADVDRVVLLGDVAVGETREAARERTETVRDVFDGFDVSATRGNADVPGVVDDVFEHSANTVVAETDDAVTVLLDSAPSEPGGPGHVDPAGVELVAERLEDGETVRIVTHYPLQRTEHLPQAFASYPEVAYPSNKRQFDAAVRPYVPGARGGAETGSTPDDESAPGADGGTIAEIVCGHLHPPARLRVRGEPLGVPLTVLEPIVRIEKPYAEAGGRTLNERVVVEDLIVEL